MIGGAKAAMKKLLTETNKINQELKKEFPRAILAVASQILKDAKKMAPVRTGALRRSGRIEQDGNTRSSAGATVTIAFGGKGSGVDYAPFVEFGRQSRAPMAPRPFLRPAIRKNQKALQAMGAEAVRNSWR